MSWVKGGVVTIMTLELEQFDVKTTFLHSKLEKQIYMKQLEGLEVEEKEDSD